LEVAVMFKIMLTCRWSVEFELGMCGIDFLYQLSFGLVFERNSDLVQNEFGSVRFEKMQFVLDTIVTYYLYNS